eukprot:NODE_922_length_1232_cov_52.923077_g690_i0.p8 GENE.NODE_922_length_1232_cov_52.923077_g690_i0~~NODE_922_length_1232_cov_52.923077_g690_i0.p8  ORF type:complete len:65 (+),score=5.04 NODE_922_length_1232_cov_52.923077_g690_i0:493-687(+)
MHMVYDLGRIFWWDMPKERPILPIPIRLEEKRLKFNMKHLSVAKIVLIIFDQVKSMVISTDSSE